jgi:hypothetical protein
MHYVQNDSTSVVSIATAAFTVIGTIVGAYFGVKAGNDNTQKAITATQNAIDGLKDESSKAAAFAAHMNSEPAQDAVALTAPFAATAKGRRRTPRHEGLTHRL